MFTIEEFRRRTGQLSNQAALAAGFVRTVEKSGYEAVVALDGVRGNGQVVPGFMTLRVSKLDGESRWTVDGEFVGSMPRFYNGWGARFCRTLWASSDICDALDERAAAEAVGA